MDESINLNTTADVNGFEEEQRGRFEIEIVKDSGAEVTKRNPGCWVVLVVL